MGFLKKYQFVTSNGYTVTVETTGEYRGHWSKDVDVHYWDGTYEGKNGSREFSEIDQADEIVEWLKGEGMEWADKRAFKFNVRYIEEVMLEETETEESLLNKAANWNDDEIAQTWDYFGMGD